MSATRGVLDRFLSGDLARQRVWLLAWLFAAAILTVKSAPWAGLTLDTDDAMRMVQVEDLLGGQAWFDTAQHRVTPPYGLSMHWSRIGDLGPAALRAAASTILPRDAARACAFIAWPLLLLGAAVAVIGQIARALGGDRAAPTAALLFGVIGPAAQFAPGRIDHHGAQILGLLACLLGAIQARRGWRIAGASALAGAVTVAIGLEALPYVGAIAGLTGLLLLVPEVKRAELGTFGAVLAVGPWVVSLLSYPAASVLSGACDQAAAPVLALLSVCGAGLVLLSLTAPRRLVFRVAALCAVGLVSVASYVAVAPACARGPFSGVDPQLASAWLSQVEESQGLPTLLAAGNQYAGLASAGLFVGLVAVTMLLGGRLPDKARFALPAGVFLFAAAVSLGRAGAATYALAVACPLVACAMVQWAERHGLPSERWTLASLLAILGCVLLPLGVMAAEARATHPGRAPAQPERSVAGTNDLASAYPADADCSQASDYLDLRALPSGVIAAPVDLGPYVLLNTSHSVLSVPYHRNGRGILAARNILVGRPADAAHRARESGVQYVVICTGGGSMAQLLRDAPHGLAAELLAGRTPEFLAPVTSGVVRAYRVRAPSRDREP